MIEYLYSTYSYLLLATAVYPRLQLFTLWIQPFLWESLVPFSGEWASVVVLFFYFLRPKEVSSLLFSVSYPVHIRFIGKSYWSYPRMSQNMTAAFPTHLPRLRCLLFSGRLWCLHTHALASTPAAHQCLSCVLYAGTGVNVFRLSTPLLRKPLAPFSPAETV